MPGSVSQEARTLEHATGPVQGLKFLNDYVYLCVPAQVYVYHMYPPGIYTYTLVYHMYVCHMYPPGFRSSGTAITGNCVLHVGAEN